MSVRRVPVFFYGLYMDEELLRSKGAAPTGVRPASVDGYALRIGARAAVVPQPGGRVHGILMELTHEELERLYAEPSVSMYRPEPLLCTTDRGAIAALCYNLPVAPAPEERNEEYATKLRALARRLQVPEPEG